MGPVGFFQPLNLVSRELDRKRGQGIIQVVGFGGANDWGCNVGLGMHPGQGDLCHWYPARLRHFADAFDGGQVIFLSITTFGEGIGLVAEGFFWASVGLRASTLRANGEKGITPMP